MRSERGTADRTWLLPSAPLANTVSEEKIFVSNTLPHWVQHLRVGSPKVKALG